MRDTSPEHSRRDSPDGSDERQPKKARREGSPSSFRDVALPSQSQAQTAQAKLQQEMSDIAANVMSTLGEEQLSSAKRRKLEISQEKIESSSLAGVIQQEQYDQGSDYLPDIPKNPEAKGNTIEERELEYYKHRFERMQHAFQENLQLDNQASPTSQADQAKRQLEDYIKKNPIKSDEFYSALRTTKIITCPERNITGENYVSLLQDIQTLTYPSEYKAYEMVMNWVANGNAGQKIYAQALIDILDKRKDKLPDAQSLQMQISAQYKEAQSSQAPNFPHGDQIVSPVINDACNQAQSAPPDSPVLHWVEQFLNLDDLGQ